MAGCASSWRFVCVFDGKEYQLDKLPDHLDPEEAEFHGCRAYRDLKGYDRDFGEEAGFAYEFVLNESDSSWGKHWWVYAEQEILMQHSQFVINVLGGVVQDVFSSDANGVLMVDWDSQGLEPTPLGVVEVPLTQGGSKLAVVAEHHCLPLAKLTNTDAAAALAAAGVEIWPIEQSVK